MFVTELDWGADIKHLPLPFDYIIGSDLVYAIDVFDLLSKTICDLSGGASSPTKALFVYELRWKDVEKWFLESLRAHGLQVTELARSAHDEQFSYEKLRIVEIIATG